GGGREPSPPAAVPLVPGTVGAPIAACRRLPIVRGLGGCRYRARFGGPADPAARRRCAPYRRPGQAALRPDGPAEPRPRPRETVTVDLHLQPDDLAKCVQCSLCLPHCPTFRVTGDETMSPRGRIALMRAVQNSGAPLTAEVADAFTTCVQCRGCETACPSGVPYGRLIDGTREAMADLAPTTSAWQGLVLAPLAHPRLLRGCSTLLALGQRAGLVPRRLALPRLPLRRPAL